jgi:predicted ATPase
MDRSNLTETGLEGGAHAGVGTFLLLVESGIRASSIEAAIHDCLRHHHAQVIKSSRGYTYLRFSRPSEAVQAGVRLVAKLKNRVLAAVMISEFEPTGRTMESVQEQLVGAASKADPGQVVTNLAVHELARHTLDADYSFDELGSFQVGQDGSHERLLLVQHPSLPKRELTAGRSRGLFRTSTFIGRDREITALRHQMDLSRTITIVGPAGIGKTALIHRFVADVESDFADGTHYIDLGPIARESMLLPTINRLLGVAKLPGEDNLDALVANFREKRALLVFDSCEHLVGPVRHVIDALLGDCPNLAVLAGSQSSLKTKGEDRFPLSGLEVPSPIEDWRSIKEYEAVALFIDRAQLANHAFQFDETNAPSVANLCRRLDGIPLAIELAATKTSILNPKQIVDRLDDRFLLLQDRQRDPSDRHQTLRATIDWSYGLLEAHDKALLRRLAVFAGTFSLDQAERVCAFDNELRPSQVFSAFEKLVDCSFLSSSSVQTVDKRFFLTETMRLYAAAKLKEVREEKDLLRRHREWCAEFSERANQELLGPDQLAWIERMDASYEDVRMVIEAGFQKGGDPLLSVDTLISCHRFFFLRNYLSEGLRLVEKAIACKGCSESRQFPRVVNMAGVLASYLGDRKRARKYVLHSYSLSREAGNREGEAASLVNLAISVQESGNLKKACRYYIRAARAFREIRSNHKLFTTLTNVLGVEADLQMFQEAHAHLDEALSLQEEIKDASTIAQLHQNAAHLYLAEGLPYRTISHTLECLPTFERLGNHNCVVIAWRTAAHAAAQLERFESASIFLGAARKQGAALEGSGRTYDQESLDDLSQRLIKAIGEQLFRSHSLIGSLMSIGQLTQELDKIRLT